MEVINEKLMSRLKENKKRIMIKCIISIIVCIVISTLLTIYINRDYKVLFIFIGFIETSILVNYFFYQLLFYFLPLKRKIEYYNSLLLSDKAISFKATIVEDLSYETYNKVNFRAYKVLDELGNSSRVLCDIDDELKIENTYTLKICSQVVISYDCE